MQTVNLSVVKTLKQLLHLPKYQSFEQIVKQNQIMQLFVKTRNAVRCSDQNIKEYSLISEFNKSSSIHCQ